MSLVSMMNSLPDVPENDDCRQDDGKPGDPGKAFLDSQNHIGHCQQIQRDIFKILLVHCLRMGYNLIREGSER